MDAWKLTLLEVQVLCLTLLLHLYESLSEVLLLFPIWEEKTAQISNQNHMETKGNKLLTFQLSFSSDLKISF